MSLGIYSHWSYHIRICTYQYACNTAHTNPILYAECVGGFNEPYARVKFTSEVVKPMTTEASPTDVQASGNCGLTVVPYHNRLVLPATAYYRLRGPSQSPGIIPSLASAVTLVLIVSVIDSARCPPWRPLPVCMASLHFASRPPSILRSFPHLTHTPRTSYHDYIRILTPGMFLASKML